MAKPTFLIVDDHDAFRAAARGLLLRRGFLVVGESATGLAGIEAASRLRPDVVLLDVQLPDIDGFETARVLLATPAPPAVVLISTRDAADYGARIRASGVLGFITKSRLSGDTLSALLRGSTEGERT
ncbi:MAG TPA: response regulator transcription factor [Candidatus Limnocylindrales bacterium]|jgi:DNA-binding NarL/FixJ family response regulator